MKKLISLPTFFIFSVFFFSVNAQWVQVLDQVTPVQIAISPEYHLDQTVYIVDDGARLLISETGGANWVTLYEASEPQDPSQAILNIKVSPNFQNDNGILMIHKDGTVKLSFDRGQQWLTIQAPDGTADAVFSANFAQDFNVYVISGVMGPVNFYKSQNGGATWQLVQEITLGGGFYSRLWNSMDTAATDYYAIQFEHKTVYMTDDKGISWSHSFTGQMQVHDLIYSPQFKTDFTVFLAEANAIYKSTNGGEASSWVNVANFTGATGIKLAISPYYDQDQVIFAAVDQAGIFRSTNGGDTWHAFNDGFNSLLPVSIAISRSQLYTLFAGTKGEEGAPGKLWRFQTTSSVSDNALMGSFKLRNFPNPFSDQTEITFEIPGSAHIRLSVYDITGQEVAILVNGQLGKGTHNIAFDNSIQRLKPGIYFIRLHINRESNTAKMIIL